jgi:alpha-tubulin suppressor-like RCC1 family protein
VACGSSHVVSVDAYGDVFVLGSNEQGQLGLETELHAKTFKKVNTDYIGKVRKALGIN